MIFCMATAIILFLLFLNIVINGTGCWGCQPGGPYSAYLFYIQVIVSAIALVWSLHWLFSGQGKYRLRVFGIASLLTGLAVIAYCIIGWRMDTSIHNQGMENLLPFLLVSSVALFVGCYKWWFINRNNELLKEDK